MSLRHVIVPSLLLVAHLAVAADAAKPEPLATPAQDQGLPYTRSARAAGLKTLGDTVAVCIGSRFAWAQGHRVRLDDDRWRDEAVEQAGEVWVPTAFATLVLTAKPAFDAAPSYLTERWTHTVPRTAALPAGTRTITVRGATYAALADLATAAGKPLARQGLLVVVGATAAPTGPAYDTVVPLFDTPEKLADPHLAAKYIPSKVRQGEFTAHAKATPEQLKNFYGDPVDWPTAPASSYDESGIDRQVLGSKVPAPGVYPRLLFSPEDIPAVQARVKGSVQGQKSLIEMEELFSATWWKPGTSDNTVFEKLAKGDIADQTWGDLRADRDPKTSLPPLLRDHKAGIHNSHVAYIPECLTAMATYALIQGDEKLSRKVAAALATFYRLYEPLVDAWNATSDSEWGSGALNGNSGSSTAWRGMHGLVSYCNLGIGLDLTGKWMTPQEREDMRRLIVKATYGRRPYSQDGTVRFRDVNWCTWDLPHYLAVAAIEGLEGCDPEGIASNVETIRAFCDWGIDDAGAVFESTGKSSGSFQHYFMAAVAAARRGTNVFAHPHLRKLLTSQVQMTSPTGYAILNSGTQYSAYGRQFLNPTFVSRLRSIYPTDRAADFLLGLQKPLSILQNNTEGAGVNTYEVAGFDPVAYRAEVKAMKRLRLPSPSYNGFVRDVLNANDWKPTTRADLGLPLDYVAPTHGVLATRSDQTKDAAFISMMVRPNHYMGAGHHHADAGMLHVAALGQDWLTLSRFHQGYDGRLFSQVQVDGHGMTSIVPGTNAYNAAASWIGATTSAGGAAAATDLTYAYTWRWMTQPPQAWTPEIEALGWEVDPTPRIQEIFAGLGRFKIRQWWHNHTFGNPLPTLRARSNPMEYVYRTAGLVRGERPYLLVTDDLKKDAKSHRYDWSAPLSGGVWKATVPGVPADQIVLAFDQAQTKEGVDRPAITPAPGSPLLLVASVGTANVKADVNLLEAPGQNDKKTGAANYLERVVLGTDAVAVNFRTVLIPFRAGEPLPSLTWDAATSTATVVNGPQTDRLVFTVESNRTKTTVQRGGAAVLVTP